MSQSPEALFRRYMEICNEALELNKNSFPYKQIWEAAEKVLNGEPVAVAIYDDRPQAIYSLTLQDSHIEVLKERKNPNHAWHITMSYLEKVVTNPEEYINNPAKIDWDWLRNRLNLD